MIPQSEAAPIGSVPGNRTVLAVEYFVHASLRRDPGLLYRARVLIGLLLLIASISAVAVSVLVLVPLPRLGEIFSVGMCLFAFLVTYALLRRLRRSGSYRFCSVAVELLLLAMFIVSIAVSGGIMQGPASEQMMLLPLIAYFFGGVRGGCRSLALILFVIAAFVAAERYGVRFPLTVGTAQDLRTSQLLSHFIELLVVSALAFTYELTARKLKSERDREHRKALALARRDALTGLPNRRCLDERLNERLRACGSGTPPRPFLLCCIDLDGFKPINDRHGHKVGDEILRTVADRLLLTVRGADLVGRRGGDEFMAILELTGSLPDTDIGSIEILAERILSGVGRPIETSVGSLRLGASLGFARYPHDGGGAETLIKAADAAMYEVKCGGGSGWRLVHAPAPADDPATAVDAAPAGSQALPTFDPFREAAAPQAKSRVLGLLDALLHPALRLDSAVLNRARVLAAALLLISALVLMTAAAMTLTPLQARFPDVSVTIALVVLVLFVLLQVLLRCTSSYVVCSMATLSILYLVLLSVISITGGAATSSCTQAMEVLPLAAYFFGGARWGNRMAVASLASIVVFVLVEAAGLRFDKVLDDAAARVSHLVVCILCVLFTSGIACAYVFIARNLERERDLEQKLVERLARTDALTGLDNRLKFDFELRTRVAAAARSGSPFSLCYLDLDGFKPINDRHGHDAGDEVLRVISERLLGCLREGDSVARYGGDEFAFLLNSVGNEEAMELTARRLLRAITAPIRTCAGMLSVRGSLGFAMFPLDGNSEDALKSAADKAMYLAKTQGGSWRSFKAPPGPGAAAPEPFEPARGLNSGSA